MGDADALVEKHRQLFVEKEARYYIVLIFDNVVYHVLNGFYLVFPEGRIDGCTVEIKIMGSARVGAVHLGKLIFVEDRVVL